MFPAICPAGTYRILDDKIIIVTEEAVRAWAAAIVDLTLTCTVKDTEHHICQGNGGYGIA